MADVVEQPTDARGRLADQSLGELMGRVSADMSELVRNEMVLAKIEMKEEVSKAGKGVGILGATAVCGALTFLLMSCAAAWGLSEVMATGFGFLTVAVLWAVAGAACFVVGRRRLKTVHGPNQTLETLKEDARWARQRIS